MGSGEPTLNPLGLWLPGIWFSFCTGHAGSTGIPVASGSRKVVHSSEVFPQVDLAGCRLTMQSRGGCVSTLGLWSLGSLTTRFSFVCLRRWQFWDAQHVVLVRTVQVPSRGCSDLFLCALLCGSSCADCLFS